VFVRSKALCLNELRDWKRWEGVFISFPSLLCAKEVCWLDFGHRCGRSVVRVRS